MEKVQGYIPPMSPHHRPSWTLQLLSDWQPSYCLLKQKHGVKKISGDLDPTFES